MNQQHKMKMDCLGFETKHMLFMHIGLLVQNVEKEQMFGGPAGRVMIE